jgi:hypothetical protein
MRMLIVALAATSAWFLGCSSSPKYVNAEDEDSGAGSGGETAEGGDGSGGRASGGAASGGAPEDGSAGGQPSDSGAGGAPEGDAEAGAAGSGSGSGGAPPTCTTQERQAADEGSDHVRDCGKVTYGSNPPSSGTHYDSWANYKEYLEPIPQGFWVHNLEHGAVVITYNCPDGCADELEQARNLIAGLSADVVCQQSAGVRRRIVMTPDPKLTTKFAASAWGWTLRASCFDADAFRTFIGDHYGQGLEAVCSNGLDPLVDYPATCGQ